MTTVVIPKPLPGTKWGVNKSIVLKVLPMTKGYCPTKNEINEDSRCPCLDYRTTKKCVCKLYEILTDKL